MAKTEYEIFLEYVFELLRRRQVVTTTFLSANAAILAVFAIMQTEIGTQDWIGSVAIVAISLIGVLACGIWRRLILQYRILLSWWFEQLRSLEDDMPGSHKLISKEYLELYTQSENKVKLGLSKYEVGITWLLTAVYLVIGVVSSIDFVFSSM